MTVVTSTSTSISTSATERISSEEQAHPEDDDVLSSIRAVKEMVEMEFSLSEHNRSNRLSIASVDDDAGDGEDATNTTTNNENSNENNNNNNNNNIENYNSWKNQCYRLKQELYEIKNKNSLELKQQSDELLSLKKYLKETKLELIMEQDMKTTLEDTLTLQNNHTQTLAIQLNESKENQKVLQIKLFNLLTSLEEEKILIDTERLTSKQLLEEKQFFLDDINKRADIEETKRLRIESEVVTLKTKIQKQNLVIEKQIQDSSMAMKSHAESIQSMNELIEKNAAAAAATQQQQQKDSSSSSATTTAAAAAADNDYKTDLIIKALKVQVKRLMESNTKLLYEKDEAAAAAAAAATAAAAAAAAAATTATTNTPNPMSSQILLELESSKKQMNIIQELKKTIQQKRTAHEKLLLNYEKEKMNGIDLMKKLELAAAAAAATTGAAATAIATTTATSTTMVDTSATSTTTTMVDTSAEPTTTSLQKKLHVLEATLIKDSNTIKTLENQISTMEKAIPKSKSSKTPSKKGNKNIDGLAKKKQLLDGMKKQHRIKSIQVSNDIVNLQLKRLVEIQRGSSSSSGVGNGNGNQQKEWNVAIKKLSENHSRIVTLRNIEEQEKEESSGNGNGNGNGNVGGKANNNNSSNDKAIGSGSGSGSGGSGSSGGGDNNNKKKKSVLPLSTTTPFKKKMNKKNNTNTNTTTTTTATSTSAATTTAAAAAAAAAAATTASGDAVQRRKRTSTSSNTTASTTATAATGDISNNNDGNCNNNDNNNNNNNSNNNAKRMKKTN